MWSFFGQKKKQQILKFTRNEFVFKIIIEHLWVRLDGIEFTSF